MLKNLTKIFTILSNKLLLNQRFTVDLILHEIFSSTLFYIFIF